MDTNTIVIIFSNMAMTIAIIGIILSMKKDIHKLEIELKIEIIKLQNQQSQFEKQMLQFESRFDKYDGVHTDIEARLAETQKQQTQFKEQLADNQNQTNTKLLQMETENKNYIKELTNKVLEAFPKSAL